MTYRGEIFGAIDLYEAESRILVRRKAMELSQNTHGQPQPPPAEDPTPMKQIISNKLAQYHDHIPGLKRLPLPVFGIILAVAVINISVWVAVGIVLVSTRCRPIFHRQT
jgi:hypothetical protein